jgi:hypothetical protein
MQFPKGQQGGSRQNRVERSLYERAVGYNYEATKICTPANREKPVYAPYVEHIPPDVTAAIFWMKNRDPQHWRDSQQLELVLGKYIISDQPMTEEQWARERATVIDAEPVAPVTPALPDEKTPSKKPNNARPTGSNPVCCIFKNKPDTP